MQFEDLEELLNFLEGLEDLPESIETIIKKLGLQVEETHIRKEYTEKINDIVTKMQELNKENDEK